MNKISHPVEPEELMAYLDGELKPERASVAATHLGECVECQTLAAELRTGSQNLKRWKVEPSESPITAAIEDALVQNLAENNAIPRTVHLLSRENWRTSFRQHWRIVAFAGGLAVVVLVMFSVPTLRRQGSLSTLLVADRDLTHLPAGSSSGSGRGMGTLVSSPAPPAPSSATLEKQRAFSRRIRDQRTQMATSLESSADSSSYSTDGQPAIDQKSTIQRQQLAESLDSPLANGPMIIRTAQLSLITKEFDKTRTNLETIIKRHHGFLGDLNASGSTGSGRTLTATLRVPADQLDAALTEVKALGRVESESQSGQDVTSQYVDLQARLGNARHTQERLTDLLRNRTGQLADVLAVEQELDRVRGEIEQMEAERKTMATQVSYATLNATITEDYKAELQVVPPSTFTRLRNAAVEGYRGVVDGLVGLTLFLLSTGPSLLLWGAILFFPARLAWKKLRSSFAS